MLPVSFPMTRSRAEEEVVLVSVVVEVASTGVAALTSEAAPFTQDVFMPEAGIAEAFDRRIR
ncbi:hypothetical protein JQ575_01245 [Bradyrhizobium sp. JYMT SZCCT0428]|nr:hypothetical protein [Bradyrhizobium sp. JYMT SZCCT0428]